MESFENIDTSTTLPDTLSALEDRTLTNEPDAATDVPSQPETQSESFEEQTDAPIDEPVGAEAELDDNPADYESLIREDIEQLRAEFPDLKNLSEITELDNPLRYAALRDLGLTPKEAYLATRKERAQADNRRHLSTAAPKSAAKSSHGMSYSELLCARELFSDISDSEIYSLYKRVSR